MTPTREEAERPRLLSPEERQEITYIANSGRLYASVAAEMLVRDNAVRTLLQQETKS